MTNAEKDYKLYVEKYCRTYHITKEEAEKHQLVKDVKKYYKDAYFGVVVNSTYTPVGDST